METLVWIASRDDAYVNQVEVALDYIMASARDQDRLWDFLHRCWVRRWHGKQQIQKCHPGSKATRYDSVARKPGHHTDFYKDKVSRISGEANCLHLEWKANGRRAVQGIGIESGNDLVSFDHHRFWNRRLLLLDLDVERLGRLVRN